MLNQKFCIIILLLFPSLLLVACPSPQLTSPQFRYQLSQQAYQPGPDTPLTHQVQGNELKFAVSFKGGGGSYDEARLERSKDSFQVILFDTDGKLQNMWVTYRLSGFISGLEPGRYRLQIKNLDGKLIAEDTFAIQ